MGNFGRDNSHGGGFGRGRFNRGRGGFGGGRPSFGGNRGGFGKGRDDRGQREMFKTTCSSCGKECEVPFRPTNGKPVYCSDCFEKMGNGGRSEERYSQSPDRSNFRPQTQPPAANNVQLEALNVKLDRIISLLENKLVEPKKSDVEAKAEAQEEVVKTPTEKKVKAVKKTSVKK